MEELMIEIIDVLGYLGVMLLMALENLFPPIPSELVLALGGFMTIQTNMTVVGVTVAATIGATAGAIILYYVGRLLSEERLQRFCASKLGRLLGFEIADIKRAGAWFVKRGAVAVFVCRFVPLVRSLISIPAGSAHMRLSVFLPFTILGTLIWNLVLVSLGRVAGSAWQSVAQYFDIYSTVAIIALMLALVSAGTIIFKRRLAQKQNEKEPLPLP